MIGKPKVCILRTDGTNCDQETAYAFKIAGGESEIVHINSFRDRFDPVSNREMRLDDYQILAIPGGFSKGDYVAAGRIFADEILRSIGEDISRFIEDGKLIIGICNGFQVLVKAGFLPNLDGSRRQSVTLTYNDSMNFEDRWVQMTCPENICVWTRGIGNIDLPVAHGEGKFIAESEMHDKLFKKSLVVFQYIDGEGNPTTDFPYNPNGSEHAIAGICDLTGRVFGLMPHPERYREPGNHHLAGLQRVLEKPYIDRNDPDVKERIRIAGQLPQEGSGLSIIMNGVEYCRNNL